jgi:hypothetical protein
MPPPRPGGCRTRVTPIIPILTAYLTSRYRSLTYGLHRCITSMYDIAHIDRPVMRRRNGALDRGSRGSCRVPGGQRGCRPRTGRLHPGVGRGVQRVVLADRRDRADHVRDRLRRHLLADPGAQRLERQPPRPAGHPAVPARGSQRPARATGREPASQIRLLRRHRPGRGVDGRVRLGGLDHPAAGRQVPAAGLPAAGRRHRHVPGPPIRHPRLQQRRPAVLPLRHPRQGAQETAHDLGAAAVAGRQGSPQVPPRRVRGHAPRRSSRRAGRSSPPTGRRSRSTRRRPSAASSSW